MVIMQRLIELAGQFVSYGTDLGCNVLWARRQDPVSLTNMVELLASDGRAKGFSSKNREGDEKRAGKK